LFGAGRTAAAAELVEGALGFVGFGMGQFCAESEGGGKTLAGEFGFAEADMGDATKMQGIGLAPGVLALFGEVEGVASGLESFLVLIRGEVGSGEGDADVDGEFAEAAGIGEEDAGFAFDQGLRKVGDGESEFASGLKAAELKFDFAGFLGELASRDEVSGSHRCISVN
jgi:hypothetical protein